MLLYSTLFLVLFACKAGRKKPKDFSLIFGWSAVFDFYSYDPKLKKVPGTKGHEANFPSHERWTSELYPVLQDNLPRDWRSYEN